MDKTRIVYCKDEDGKVIIENVDLDSACILFLSELGKYGEFNGKKIYLKEFVKEYDDFYFEILDELYGFNQVEYIGYIRSPKIDELTQMSLSLYFSGDIVYETDE